MGVIDVSPVNTEIYLSRLYIYWYFDSKAQTRSFNIGIRLILVYFLKCTLKSILGGCTCCLIPAPIFLYQYNYVIYR